MSRPDGVRSSNRVMESCVRRSLRASSVAALSSAPRPASRRRWRTARPTPGRRSLNAALAVRGITSPSFLDAQHAAWAAGDCHCHAEVCRGCARPWRGRCWASRPGSTPAHRPVKHSPYLQARSAAGATQALSPRRVSQGLTLGDRLLAGAPSTGASRATPCHGTPPLAVPSLHWQALMYDM